MTTKVYESAEQKLCHPAAESDQEKFAGLVDWGREDLSYLQQPHQQFRLVDDHYGKNEACARDPIEQRALKGEYTSTKVTLDQTGLRELLAPYLFESSFKGVPA